MNPILKNILGLIIGLVLGSFINSGLIQLGMILFPLPEGVDPNDMESIAANIENFGEGNFLMTFLAHALGVFVGSAIAIKLCATRQHIFAYVIGGLFFLGGIMASIFIPAPTWFTATDLVLAYFPMAWLAIKIVKPKAS